MELYLSTDKTIDPATDRLLKNVTFSTGTGAWAKQEDDHEGIGFPINGLSGKYYYGAVVASSKNGFIEAGFHRPLFIGGQ